MLHRFLHIIAILCAFTAALDAQVTVDFPVVQDSWVNSNNTTRNYGSQSTLQIKHDNPIRTPYLQFQTFGITGTITSAILNFRFLYDSGTVTAHKANSESWDESTITYANQPGFSSTSTGSVSVSSGAWASIPVTPAITGNGFFSFALRSTSINGEIHSKESSYVPYLRVTYQPLNLAPVAQPENYSVLFNTVRTVAAPGVLANDTDPNGDPITAQLVTNTTSGTLNLSANGSFTYQPNTGFTGNDSFTYRALDNTTGQSSPVTVTLNVLAEGVGQLTPAELNQIQSDLGITLSLDQQIELATLVKPVTSESWRSAADARIEQNRKANLNITVANSGNPIPGASVRARLKRKTFHFGGVLDLPEFMNGISGGVSAADYRNVALKYFDSVGINNALKPKQSLYTTANNNTTNLQNTFFPWCAANNIPVRGHLLLWPGGTFMSAPVEAKVVEIENTATPTQTQLDELRALVDYEITTWASMWHVYEWDVVNEVLGNHRIQDILGPNEIVRWFQLAQTASTNAGRPNTGRLINEYQIISGDALTNGNTRKANYKLQIQYLIDNNAPITGIGFQSRFRFRREDPALLYSRLEEFTGYNMDMIGTEFEVSANPTYVNGAFLPSENLRAQMTEEVMTTYYSHPKVTGLFAWEFVANPPPADPVDSERALLTSAGSPKLNALVWYYINRIRYHTDTTLTTNAQGQVSLRGFKGDYEITVNTGSGSPVTVTQSLSADTSVEIGGITTTTLDVVEDSHAQEASPTATAGNSATLQLKTPNGSSGRVAYLKFNLAQVSGTIQSAKLRLYIPAAGTPENGEVNPVQALAVSSNTWTEAALTWNTRPGTGDVLGTGTVASAPGMLEITLDPAAITPGGIWSVALNETGNSYGTIASSENTSAYPIPQLLVTSTGSISNHAPVFAVNPISGAEAMVNIPYTGSLAGTATDTDPGDTISYAKVAGPNWLLIAADGTLSGTPSSVDAGSNAFTVSASDGTDTTTATLNITVTNNEYTLNVTEDTHAQEANPTAAAPNSATLQVRTPNGSLGRVAYLKFNLAQVSGTIQSARLRIHIPPAGAPPTGANGETNTIQALALTDHAWTEAALTWNNRPATGAVLGSGSLAAENTPGSLEINLDPAFVTTGGFWSVALNETGNSYGTIASSENTSDYPIPQLIIVTGDPDTDGDGLTNTLDPDDDNDGIPDTAETAYGMNALSAADGIGDGDSDGISAVVEHRLGLNPTMPSVMSEAFRIEPASGGNLALTIRHRTGDHNTAPILQYWQGSGEWQNLNLSNPPPGLLSVLGSTTNVTSDSISPLETHSHTLLPLAPRLFFRLSFGIP